ncbi:hypothetical protein FHK92_16470 [Pseudomonas brassicacearum subsp. neoaurantiaca]|uniref:Uncharacterized protein n=1 Tax=Pseudomonas brassicacearum subsp. neoaurantiaca TaxID=494916 RepID=A0A7V8RMS4_9PSED|nr:hypothetical protein [Pseudomonas brassicacearum subsp. neoaurantiaca]
MRWRPLWRGSLLPLGREAAPIDSRLLTQASASQPSGSKLPRHKNPCSPDHVAGRIALINDCNE